MAVANPPSTDYTWYHNNTEIRRSTNKTFHISKVSLSHAGKYSCLAENSVGSGLMSQEAELDIQCEYSQSLWVLDGEDGSGPRRKVDECRRCQGPRMDSKQKPGALLRGAPEV